MGQITSIEPQARHPNRFNLFVDHQFVLGLSAILAVKLRVGQTLDDAELKRLEDEEAFETARDKALRFLEPRPRSSMEVKQQLLKKGIAAEIAERVIARLTDAGLLDDAAFAKYWVENREQFKPRAGRALRFELKRKGLANSEITEAIGAIDESDSAYRAGQARAKRWSDLERRAFLDKMGAFLVRRGFAYDVAKNAAKRLWDDNRAEES